MPTLTYLPLSAEPAAIGEVAAFIARVNANPAHHIGVFDDQAQDIANVLSGLEIPVNQSMIVAREDEEIVGVLGFDYGVELGRAWLYGPLVEHAAWDEIVEQLYASMQPLLPPATQELEIFANVANEHVAAFATRHNYPVYGTGDHLILRFDRSMLAKLPASDLALFAPSDAAAFVALHDQLFPRTYFAGQAIIERLSDHHRLFVVRDGEELQGYIYVEVKPESGEGSIEFVGVAPAARGQGLGRQLVTAALHWLYSFPKVETIFLTTNSSNEAAVAVYERVGFGLFARMRAWRKEIA